LEEIGHSLASGRRPSARTFKSQFAGRYGPALPLPDAYDLYYQITLNPDWAGYEDLECSLNDPGDGWYFYKNSNSDFDVTQNSSSCP
jgi:hypothetical protein